MVGMVLVDQLWEKLMVNTTMIISILFLSGSCLSLIHPIKAEAWSLASQDIQETSSLSQCPSHQQNHTATSRCVILIPTINEQMMETKLRTFARKQILHKKTFKNRLKYSVHMTKALWKTSGPL